MSNVKYLVYKFKNSVSKNLFELKKLVYNVPVQVKQKESETKIMIVWNFIWQWKTAHLIYDKNILKRVSKIHVDMKRVNRVSDQYLPCLPSLSPLSRDLLLSLLRDLDLLSRDLDLLRSLLRLRLLLVGGDLERDLFKKTQ